MMLPVIADVIYMVTLKKTCCQGLTWPMFACFWIGDKSTMNNLFVEGIVNVYGKHSCTGYTNG